MIKASAITGKGKVFDVPRMKRDLSNLLTAMAKGIKADYGVTTQTWKERPRFDIQSDQYGRDVTTTDKVFIYVDMGTKPHDIAPPPGGVLAFGGPGFKAKTRPRIIGSGAGSRGSGKIFTKKVIKHPGTEAREFTGTIGDKWEAELLKRARTLWRA